MDSRPWPFFVLAEARKMPNLSEQMPSHAVGRDSQTELLRIVAMVMILILHANFLGVGAPEHADFLEDAPRAWGQMVLESLCIVAVDVFVLISSWYGIRFRKRRLAGFLFQVWFFTFVLYFGSLLFDRDLPPTPRFAFACAQQDDRISPSSRPPMGRRHSSSRRHRVVCPCAEHLGMVWKQPTLGRRRRLGSYLRLPLFRWPLAPSVR